MLGIENIDDFQNLITLPNLPIDGYLVARAEKIHQRDEGDQPSSTQSDPGSGKLDIAGMLGVESIYFTQSAADPRQNHSTNQSLVAEVELVYEWDRGNQLIAFKPFLRLDQHDRERSHFDVRELIYEYASRNWELRLGVGKVFWGVTEFQHLVDIINQTDLIENIDGEEKLGQPMINLALIQDWGTMDFFLLPYFRERTFPGVDGRLRSLPVVDTENPLYESGDKRTHLDAAVRYSHYFGDWDIGLAHFYGTSREPRLLPGLDSTGSPVLLPFYDLINQTSLDVQATKGNTLWKLEYFYRRGQGSPFSALASGFEYTFVGAFESNVDIGLLGEYHYDSRGESAASIFEDDIAIGSRIAFNDIQSTEALFGIIWDRNTGGLAYNLEASRRIGDSFLLELESRIFSGQSRSDPLFALNRDDYVELTFSYNF